MKSSSLYRLFFLAHFWHTFGALAPNIGDTIVLWRIGRLGGDGLLELTEEQRREIYLEVKRENERKWRNERRSEESKAKRREYMREYMKGYRVKA